MRQEVVRGENVGDDGPRLGKRQRVATSPETFALDERVRDRREDDVAMPPVKGAAFEMIEAEFVLQFGVLLFDRPALMSQAHERLERPRRRQMDEVVPGLGGWHSDRADRAARSPGRGAAGANRERV